MEDLRSSSDVDVDEYIFAPFLGMVNFLLIDVLYHTMCCCDLSSNTNTIPSKHKLLIISGFNFVHKMCSFVRLYVKDSV